MSSSGHNFSFIFLLAPWCQKDEDDSKLEKKGKSWEIKLSEMQMFKFVMGQYAAIVNKFKKFTQNEL